MILSAETLPMQNICNGVIWPYNSGGIDREREVLQMDRGGGLLPFGRRYAGARRVVPRSVLFPGASVCVWFDELFGDAASAVRSVRPDLCARVVGAVPRAAPLGCGRYRAGRLVFARFPRHGGTRHGRRHRRLSERRRRQCSLWLSDRARHPRLCVAVRAGAAGQACACGGQSAVRAAPGGAGGNGCTRQRARRRTAGAPPRVERALVGAAAAVRRLLPHLGAGAARRVRRLSPGTKAAGGERGEKFKGIKM